LTGRMLGEPGGDREVRDRSVIKTRAAFAGQLIEDPLVLLAYPTWVLRRIWVGGMVLRPLHREHDQAEVQYPKLVAHTGDPGEYLIQGGDRGSDVCHATMISNICIIC